MIWSLPFKIELKNLCEIIKQCFGVDEKDEIVMNEVMNEVIINEVITKQPTTTDSDFVMV
jgi:hypothetical protein